MKARKITYDFVFSMGEVCFCANYLQSMCLRKLSTPFDWVAGATFGERMRLLMNDFDNFFNMTDLVYHGKREYPQPCNIYYNTRTHIVFNHDFSLFKSFDEMFLIVKERYNRRIKRLYELMNKSKKVLIVYMERADTQSGVSSDKELCNLMKDLNQKFTKAHIDLMYIRHNENMKDGEFTRQRIDEHVIVAQCFNRSLDENSSAVGNLHNVRKIFADISCRNNSFRFLFYWVKKIFKTIYRHKIKNGEEYIRLLGIKIYRRKIKI